MFDVDKVATQIDEEADSNAIIILGTAIKEDLQDEIAVTVIAAGFENPRDFGGPVLPKTEPEEIVQGETGLDSEALVDDYRDTFGKGIEIPRFLR